MADKLTSLLKDNPAIEVGKTTSLRYSENLDDSYGYSSRGRERKIHLLDGDDHSLTKNSLKAEEKLCDLIMKCAGVEIAEDEQKKVVQRPLDDGTEKIEDWNRGGDLRGQEKIE